MQTGRDITAICCSEITTIANLREFHVCFRFWETATYPSPKLTLTPTSHSGKNVGLGEGSCAVSQKRIIIRFNDTITWKGPNNELCHQERYDWEHKHLRTENSV